MVAKPASVAEAPVDKQSVDLAERAERAEQLLERSTQQVERQESAPGRSTLQRASTFRPAGESIRKPGFFDDPMGRHDQRYWDGVRWTEYVKVDGRRTVDPL